MSDQEAEQTSVPPEEPAATPEAGVEGEAGVGASGEGEGIPDVAVDTHHDSPVAAEDATGSADVKDAAPSSPASPVAPASPAAAATDDVVAAAVREAVAEIMAERNELAALVQDLQAQLRTAQSASSAPSGASAEALAAKEKQVVDLSRQLASVSKQAEEQKIENQKLLNSISAASTAEGGSNKELLLASQLEAARAKITELNALFVANEQKRRSERARTCELEAELRVITGRVLVCPRCRAPVEPPSHTMQKSSIVSPSWVTRQEARVLQRRLREYLMLPHASDARRQALAVTADELEELDHHARGFWRDGACGRVRAWFSLNVQSGTDEAALALAAKSMSSERGAEGSPGRMGSGRDRY